MMAPRITRALVYLAKLLLFSGTIDECFESSGSARTLAKSRESDQSGESSFEINYSESLLLCIRTLLLRYPSVYAQCSLASLPGR